MQEEYFDVICSEERVLVVFTQYERSQIAG